MERLHAKIITGVVMLFSIFICFVLPIKLNVFFKKRGDRGQYYLDLLACFAGGVFLAVYLIYMAPEARELVKENLMLPNNITYPIPDVLIGFGFFLMLVLNRIVVSLCHSFHTPKKQEISVTNSSSRTSETMTTQLYNNTKQNSTANVIIDNASLDAVDFDPNSPYPLARRSSITDVVQQESMARSIVMMLALSFDSVFEGMTTGLKRTTMEVWVIFIGNFVHETIIAFCLGLQLVKTNDKKKVPVIIAAAAYAIMNPLGLAIATIFYEVKQSGPELDLASGLIQAVISGCFIYVTFCEILEGQLQHQTAYTKIISMLAGFAFLAAFAALPEEPSFIHSSQNTTTSTVV